MQNITSMLNVHSVPAFLSEGRHKFTPAQANWVFQNCRYEFNRNEKTAKAHISALARMMQAGSWRPASAIEFARMPDGSLTLVDGHHRMLAQVAAGVDIVWTVLIHDVDGASAVRDLFWTYDTTLRKRSINNVMNGVQAAENMGLSKTMTTAIARASVFIEAGLSATNGPESTTFTPEETLLAMQEWSSQARHYDECVKAAPPALRRKLLSVQICAAALITLRIDDQGAKAFWMDIAKDDGLRRGTPQKTLLDWMRDTHLAGSGLTASTVAVARAWNAYRSGSTLSAIRIGRNAVRFSGSKYEVRG